MEGEIWSLEKMRSLFDLTGKVAIVTGGSGAFGHAAAKGMAAYGADVVITSRRIENLERAAADIAEPGCRRHVRADCRGELSGPCPTWRPMLDTPGAMEMEGQ